MYNTECNHQHLLFQDFGTSKVVADFIGGTISSDAGALLPCEVNIARNFIDRFSDCFIDYRDQRYVEHSVRDLVAQRVFGLCLGYEDLVDNEILRADPLFAPVCGKLDPTGMTWKSESDRGNPLAGKSTLNRTELHPRHLLDVGRYHRIQVNGTPSSRSTSRSIALGGRWKTRSIAAIVSVCRSNIGYPHASESTPALVFNGCIYRDE
jgi:hypothetical protein